MWALVLLAQVQGLHGVITLGNYASDGGSTPTTQLATRAVVGLWGYLLDPALVQWNLRVGIARDRQTLSLPDPQVQTFQLVPFAGRMLFKSQYFSLQVGYARNLRTRTATLTDLTSRYEGLEQRGWAQLQVGDRLFLNYQRSTFDNQDPQNRVHQFQETLSLLTWNDLGAHRLTHRIWFENFWDGLQAYTRVRLSYRLQHHWDLSRGFLDNSGMVWLEPPMVSLSGRSQWTYPYAPGGMVSLGLSEQYAHTPGATPYLATLAHVLHRGKMGRNWTVEERLSFQHYSGSVLVQDRATFFLGTRGTYRLSDWVVHLSPYVRLYGGRWVEGQRNGGEARWGQAVQVSPPLRAWIPGLALLLEEATEGGARAGYLRDGGPRSWRTRLGVSARSFAWRELHLLFTWRWDRGLASSEPQVIPFDRRTWSITAQFRLFPASMGYAESWDRTFDVLTQNFFFRYRFRPWDGLHFTYVQRWGRNRTVGYIKHVWEHTLTFSLPVVMLRLEGEGWLRKYAEDPAWLWGYRILITRAFRERF